MTCLNASEAYSRFASFPASTDEVVKVNRDIRRRANLTIGLHWWVCCSTSALLLFAALTPRMRKEDIITSWGR